MHASSALVGWEDEDYERNQRKLKELADKLSGKTRRENPEVQ